MNDDDDDNAATSLRRTTGSRGVPYGRFSNQDSSDGSYDSDDDFVRGNVDRTITVHRNLPKQWKEIENIKSEIIYIINQKFGPLAALLFLRLKRNDFISSIDGTGIDFFKPVLQFFHENLNIIQEQKREDKT